jgi:uncharacterized membrane protein YdjX (TVP38/TMEM64 family)
MSRTSLFRLCAVVFVLGALLVLGRLVALNGPLAAALEWVRGLGLLGLLIVVLAYMPAALLLFPVWLLSAALGYCYGPYQGFVAAFVGSMTASAVVFLFGRTVGRRWVEARLRHHPRFRALDKAVGRDGFKIVLLSRLSPLIPYILLNYAFSLTRVRFRTFMLATAIGSGPSILLHVYVGTTLHRLSEIMERREHFDWLVLVVGLVPMVVLVIYLARLARRALAEAGIEEAAVGDRISEAEALAKREASMDTSLSP